MRSLAAKTVLSQASNFPHGKKACKFCTSADLFLDQRGMHFGYFCRSCGRWQGKWIKHSEVKRLRQSQAVSAVRFPVFNVAPKPATAPIYRPAGEQLRADFDSPRADSHESCHERFQKLENTIAGYDRELKIVLKAIWACGILQSRGNPPSIDVDDELVDKLGRELAEAEAR
jgi:hypothetical protein